jgi:hypothetical protein
LERAGEKRKEKEERGKPKGGLQREERGKEELSENFGEKVEEDLGILR